MTSTPAPNVLPGRAKAVIEIPGGKVRRPFRCRVAQPPQRLGYRLPHEFGALSDPMVSTVRPALAR
jgi:hypothetical protein